MDDPDNLASVRAQRDRVAADLEEARIALRLALPFTRAALPASHDAYQAVKAALNEIIQGVSKVDRSLTCVRVHFSVDSADTMLAVQITSGSYPSALLSASEAKELRDWINKRFPVDGEVNGNS
jgi:hypothetical protein